MTSRAYVGTTTPATPPPPAGSRPARRATASSGYRTIQDWFRISLTEGETYAISLQRWFGLPDAHVWLIDSDGNATDFNHDVLTHTASADGTYFIAVEDGFGFTGSYELSVEQLIA